MIVPSVSSVIVIWFVVPEIQENKSVLVNFLELFRDTNLDGVSDEIVASFETIRLLVVAVFVIASVVLVAFVVVAFVIVEFVAVNVVAVRFVKIPVIVLSSDE